MEITTYSHFRQQLKKFLDWVDDSKAPLFVTRSKQNDVVVISKAEYESMLETLHLLSSPKNALRLQQGLDEYAETGGTERKLIEE